MSETAVVLTVAECEARIAALLAQVGTCEAVLRERGHRFALDAHELAALQEIDGLRYLMGGRE